MTEYELTPSPNGCDCIGNGLNPDVFPCVPETFRIAPKMVFTAASELCCCEWTVFPTYYKYKRGCPFGHPLLLLMILLTVSKIINRTGKFKISCENLEKLLQFSV